ncbi:glycosyltransferase [Brevundimonas bacteroides]|uniref:glycosyltransferase n=1 Tax=Brevundimonas bacteroides TaxID=74311 RepID=UPI000AF30640|nr:glycosyltransferase [Brevundimonas bacteroides]
MNFSAIRSLFASPEPVVEAEQVIDTSLRESEGRTRGDTARDAGSPGDAIEGYEAHLAQHPTDFAIWVQLGHMLKDSGRPLEADEAYGRALELRPGDADLLLHHASLKRALGHRRAAMVLFRRLATSSLCADVIAQMTAPDMAKHLNEADERRIAAHISRAVSASLCDLALMRVSGLVPHSDGSIRLVNDDPRLKLVPTTTSPGSTLGALRIELEQLNPERPVSGQIFLNYGDGFDANDCIVVEPRPGARRIDLTLPIAGPANLKGLRWDPDDKPNTIRIHRLTFLPTYDPDAAIRAVVEAFPPEIDLSREVTAAREALARSEMDATTAAWTTLFLTSHLRGHNRHYEAWRRRWIEPRPRDYDRIREMTGAMAIKPTFSLVIPVYDTPIPLLTECLNSILAQTWPHFEVCLADDCSPNPKVLETLDAYARRDSRIKVIRRTSNGHISAASNSALASATGDFVVLMDHDDVIPDYALFCVAHAINQNPKAQILFSDEDKITIAGERFQPYFKGDFDPWLLFGHNMVSHLGVYRRDLLEKIGGFRLGLEGSQDYDLVLRAWEEAGDEAVVHIPHVLYHWRAIPGSTAVSADQKSYAIVAARTAISSHFARTDGPFVSAPGFAAGNTALKRTRNFDTAVSIIIPTRDGLEDLRACIDSIRAFDHRATEILIVDNGSDQVETLDYLAALERDGVARVIRDPRPFNFSALNNAAARGATGEVLCFLNNDTEVVTKDWLDRARALLSMPKVGVVGARLLYPDGALQHFGVYTGTAEHGVASHGHHGLAPNGAGYFSKARLTQQFSAVTAACLFIRRAVFDQVGGFDPELVVAYNDVDLCLKVRQAGWQVVADADLVLVHKESRTRGADTDGEKAARLDREATLMRERWGETLARDPFYSPNHSLDGQFGFAHPPRVPMPWREGEVEAGAIASVAVEPSPPPKVVGWQPSPLPIIKPLQRFDDLPPEVSPDVLRRRYADLTDKSDDWLIDHYERQGREEGRVAADVAERENFLPLIEPDARVLEIGPYFTPAFKGPNVRYLDVFDGPTLRTLAQAEGADPNGCPEVIHYTNGLTEAAGADFDVVFSSHAIEHQPDLISHLQQVADALRPGGMYWIICPDKRFCFDHKRPASTIADVLDARGRTRNTRRNVIDQVVLSDHNDPVRHWRGDHDDVSALERERLTWAIQHIEEKGDAYIDVHAWHLTPPVFRRILATLADLELSPFKRFRVYDTPLNRNEFMAVLARED